MGENVIFWGCQIPARFPFVEKSIRTIFKELDYPLKDLDGFTCCPEKALINNMSEETWYLTAARNLSVAEASGKDVTLIQPCNGCYSTLKSVNSELKFDLKLKEKINKGLNAVGAKYDGEGIDVKHLIEVLHDVIGTHKIQSRVKTPLTGLKIAVHPGCHMTRPSNAIHFDDPFFPKKFDAIVTALGAQSAAYETRMLCCGGELGNIGDIKEGEFLTRQKLLDLKKREIDAITVACPACFKQFDGQQFMMQREGEDFNIPVFFVSELVGIAFDISAAELGIDSHRIKTEGFFKKLDESKKKIQKVKEHFDADALKACYECGACIDDCPAARSIEGYDPKELFEKVLKGDVDELLNDPKIWQCLECHTCSELCPQMYGMETVFTTLKKLANSRGTKPGAVEKGQEMFRKTSKVGEPSLAQRKKLKLPETPASGKDELKKLLESELVKELFKKKE
ncbi:MAG: hypothetical protein A3H37_01320 [Candidatus Schekmanbacteria bacterium RIFCSPLOWO2_02_FULL_38_14]|uniref:4Fe-4S ferredoxin-type domain-containing protein n=1 Tax=Candidatus Schekmanbacteria bacterium RIFCSPLOWO2_12_FULL_38_15 TaxID=1817883 RepID=A0A1F7SIL0_9BACT|nr:MAG: hypothetical protein A3H37_01320 [Candidatus Schekmanbacteria bacterium RIFCSPLOWO2_02_FULL_38_14]OGL53017.1 MAG: hypothetical protein A3G31_08875 [Candidatus Schekmanbacteria bacterium RIFCSPLOWO2_12_FULL_38_15]